MYWTVCIKVNCKTYIKKSSESDYIDPQRKTHNSLYALYDALIILF